MLDAMTIIDYLDCLEVAELILTKKHLDTVSVGIESIPDEFSNSEDWLSHLSKAFEMIVLDLNFDCLGGHERAASAAMWPANEATNVLRLVSSDNSPNSPLTDAVRGEAIRAAAL